MITTIQKKVKNKKIKDKAFERFDISSYPRQFRDKGKVIHFVVVNKM